MRAIAGYGGYEAWSKAARAHVDVIKQFTEIHAGYQTHFAATTLKLFVGYQYLTYASGEADALISGKADEHGLKISLESWTWITDRVWLSADGAFSTIASTYDARLRLGWRVLDSLSIGPEVAIVSDRFGERFNAGVFGRYSWSSGEARLAAGAVTTSDDDIHPYVSATLMFQF